MSVSAIKAKSAAIVRHIGGPPSAKNIVDVGPTGALLSASLICDVFKLIE